MTTEDSTLSYLPLAHIFDRVVEEFALYSGARIGYYQVGTCYLPSQPSLSSRAEATQLLLVMLTNQRLTLAGRMPRACSGCVCSQKPIIQIPCFGPLLGAGSGQRFTNIVVQTSSHFQIHVTLELKKV